MKIKKILFVISFVILLTGCSATYELDIHYDNFNESLKINSILIEEDNYYFPSFYNSISLDEYDVDVNQKLDGIEYYNTILDSNSNIVSFDYQFKVANFSISNIANSFYSAFIFKKYDYDEDGEEDYYLLTTTDDFSAFDLYDDLNDVTIKIKNNHEVISTNADEVDGDLYIWYMSRGDTDGVNMVYDPDKIVDNRTMGQKIIDSEYFQVFLILMLIVITGIVCFFILKKKSDFKNRI